MADKAQNNNLNESDAGEFAEATNENDSVVNSASQIDDREEKTEVLSLVQLVEQHSKEERIMEQLAKNSKS